MISSPVIAAAIRRSHQGQFLLCESSVGRAANGTSSSAMAFLTLYVPLTPFLGDTESSTFRENENMHEIRKIGNEKQTPFTIRLFSGFGFYCILLVPDVICLRDSIIIDRSRICCKNG